jgi:hypothetical protein
MSDEKYFQKFDQKIVRNREHVEKEIELSSLMNLGQ